MKRLFITLLFLLVLCPLAGYAQETAESPAVPFHISSFDTAFAMQGDFEGNYRVYSDSIEVSLTKAVVRIGRHCPYKGQRVFTALRFALATAAPDGKWDTTFKSKKLPVGRIMSPGDEYSLDEVRFSIPKDQTTDLSKYWFVVEMGDMVLDHPTKHAPVPGYAFAVSGKDIFIAKKQEQ